MFKLLASASVAALISTTAFASTISTLADENDDVTVWGLPDTAAYGQTFTLDDAASLTSLAFRINDGGTAIGYDLHIAAWTGSLVSGGPLFSVSSTTSGSGVMETVSNSLGDTMVGVGEYVAFFQATSNGTAAWGTVTGSDAYDGGEFVFQNNGGDISEWTTIDWTPNFQGAGADLAFEIVTGGVAVVPLPASLPLLLAGFGGLAALRRRKKA